MSTGHFMPRTRSMTVVELFREGPWEAIVPWWIAGAILAAVWAASTPARITVVTAPLLCGLAGAVVAGMAGVVARSRYVHRPGAGRLLVGALTVFGAAAGFAAATFLFAATMARGGDCAPLVTTGVPAGATWFSFAMPVVLWLAWCRYLIAGLQGVGDYDATRIAAFSKQLLRILPVRGLMTLLVIGSAVAVIVTRYRIDAELSSAPALMSILQRGDAASLVLLRNSDATNRIESQRQSAATAARTRLESLQFDAARPLVRAAVCELVQPGTALEEDLAAAEKAFLQLDNELAYGFATWQPTAVSGRTLIELLPFGDDPKIPRFPFLWSGESGTVPVDTLASAARIDVTYRSERVMEAWVLALKSGASTRNGAVAIKLLGTSGVDTGLADVVSRRLGRKPDRGVQVVGVGAMCVSWSAGPFDVRLGPALVPGESVTPGSPIWLSVFDRDATAGLRQSHAGMPAVFAATYGCEDQAQSH